MLCEWLYNPFGEKNPEYTTIQKSGISYIFLKEVYAFIQQGYTHN